MGLSLYCIFMVGCERHAGTQVKIKTIRRQDWPEKRIIPMKNAGKNWLRKKRKKKKDCASWKKSKHLLRTGIFQSQSDPVSFLPERRLDNGENMLS